MAMEGLSGSQSSPDAQKEKANFRSCGRFAQKVQPVHAGTVRQPDAVPTIPSRIETTLFKGKRERKGFGSNSLRFSVNPDSGIDPDAPGPGNYGQQKAFHQEMGEKFLAPEHIHLGQRGTGGFASRSRRFGARSLPTLPMAGLGCPGPGMYDATSVVNKLKDRSDFLQGKTAVFAAQAPEAVSAKMRSLSVPVPGPGQYKLPVRQSSLPGSGASVAAFKSTSKRGEAGPEQGDNPATIPGPGAYYSQKPILPPNGDGNNGLNAVFKEPSSRKYVAINPDLPAASDKAIKALGDFSYMVAKECVGTRPTDLPGPGIYDQDRDSMWQGRDVGVHGMSSFLPGPKRIEWGDKEVGGMPGPGGYDPHLPNTLKLTTAKSSFVSATEQHGFANLQKGPGPCYYKAGKLNINDTKSFILNARKRWL